MKQCDLDDCRRQFSVDKRTYDGASLGGKLGEIAVTSSKDLSQFIYPNSSFSPNFLLLPHQPSSLPSTLKSPDISQPPRDANNPYEPKFQTIPPSTTNFFLSLFSPRTDFSPKMKWIQ
jgi:hypothetical protein